MIKTKIKKVFTRKIKWLPINNNKIESVDKRFVIDVSFRKEGTLRDRELRGRVGVYGTIEEAKNQAEFVV